MASEGKAGTEIIGRWKVMGVNLKPQLETLPQLTARYNEFVKLTADAEDLENRQAQLKADLQELNHRRRDLFKAGEDMRNRLAAALKFEHGFTSERLLEFGLKPRRTRGLGKKTKEKLVAPPTAPSSTATAT